MKNFRYLKIKYEGLPKAGEIYRNFKGRKYVINGLTVDADDNQGRLRIEYTSLEDCEKYKSGTRFSSSLERFCGEKIIEEDNNRFKKGDIVKRFIKVYPITDGTKK